MHVVVCVFAFHKVKEQLVGRSQSVLGHVTDMTWLVPDHLASDFPSYFSHRECDSPRDSQPFLPFALVIEIEPVTSRGPCNTVQLSPDGLEGFNVFLHGLFASDFVDSVADVPTSAVVRRARDGAIHGIFGQGSEYFSGVSKQKPALPAGFDPVRLLAEPDDPILVHADVTWDHALFRVAEVIPVSVADERFDHRTRDLAYPQQRRLNRMRVCGSS